MISKRVQNMDASGIRKVFELGKSLENPIDMSIGQPNFPVPDQIKDAACQAICDNKNSYSLTQGILELRGGIVQKLEKKNGIKAKTENILVTSAVSGGLSIALPAVMDAGDEVIIFDPGFVGYKQQILLFGGVPIPVEKNDDFSINFELLENAITEKTKAIVFNSPENPTGHVANQEEIDNLIAIAKKHDLVIISDEIYEDFVYGAAHISVGASYEKTITLGGFSKSHAMTGWRVGYLCAPEELAEQMMKIQQFTFVCAPTPLQHAACEALKTDISDYVEEYQKKRDMIYDGLREYYDLEKSQGAFYFFIKYPCEPSVFMQKCLERKLLIVPGNVFSAHDTHFRLSFATTDDNIKKAIKILQEIAIKTRN